MAGKQTTDATKKKRKDTPMKEKRTIDEYIYDMKAFKTVEELHEKIESYFKRVEETGEIVCEEGLAYTLGVTVNCLDNYYEGKRCPEFQEEIQRAYAKINYLRAIDPRFQDKAMATRYIFEKKQKRYGGYQDRTEQKNDISVNVKFGKGIDNSDFE